MNETALRSVRGHTFEVAGRLNALGGQCSSLDLALRRGGSGTRYVVKWLHDSDSNAVARNEGLLHMQALQAIPQVLAPRDIVRDGKRVGVVTPYLEGGVPLESVLVQPLGIRQHLVLGLQLAHVVTVLEGMGLRQGDLSSQNLMVVMAQGVPKLFLLDMDNATGPGLPPAPMLGGEYYYAPEREDEGCQPDAASEAYSLAALLHELLLGTHPLRNDAGLSLEQARRSDWLYDPDRHDCPSFGFPAATLHPAVVDAFRDTLQPVPARRTAAARWRELLRILVAEGRLARCAGCQGPLYIHSQRRECPHCGVAFERTVITTAGQRLSVTDTLVLGRQHCGNPSVSRAHLLLSRKGPELLAEVVSATSPTWVCVDGHWRQMPAGHRMALPSGALLRLHDSEFLVE